MKPAKIFQQYIWIVNALRQYKRLSLEQLTVIAPTNARAAILRKYFIVFIIAFIVLVGLLLCYRIIPVVVLYAGLAAGLQQVLLLLQLDDLHRRFLILFFLHTCFVLKC